MRLVLQAVYAGVAATVVGSFMKAAATDPVDDTRKKVRFVGRACARIEPRLARHHSRFFRTRHASRYAFQARFLLSCLTRRAEERGRGFLARWPESHDSRQMRLDNDTFRSFLIRSRIFGDSSIFVFYPEPVPIGGWIRPRGTRGVEKNAREITRA